VTTLAQVETPPAPAPPKTVSIPSVQEKKLANGLRIAVVRRPAVPLVTVQLLIMNGASGEDEAKAGLANLTADLLTKGTKTRSATQIADDMAFIGSELNTGAGWNSSSVSFTVTPDKLQQALAVMADVVLNPSFKQEELDLLRSQTLDELKYNLKQPSFIANYVASKYTFDEHPAGGTPESLQTITRSDVVTFHKSFYAPEQSVIIFSGDVDLVNATSLATRAFGQWRMPLARKEIIQNIMEAPSSAPQTVQGDRTNRILVVDLPNSGQAAVGLAKMTPGGRVDPGMAGKKSTVNKEYYPAIVMNSVLGGGYSSRLNYEIRIKRGLSYGAGSGFAWRYDSGNFTTRAQTKNMSAAEVAELTLAEIKRLTNESVANDELVPRKSTLTGGFGRNLETTNGLASAVGELYSFGISPNELNSYVSNVNNVTDAQIRDFASKNLLGGDLIIVGDYSVFKDDLAKRFPGMTIDVIKADDLDLSKPNLRK